MQQFSQGLNKKLTNIFGRKEDDGNSYRPVSYGKASGVFGMDPNSQVTSPNTSLVKQNQLLSASGSTDAKVSKFMSCQNSVEKKHKRQRTFGTCEMQSMKSMGSLIHQARGEDEFGDGAICAEEEDYGFIDEEIVKFANEIKDKEPLADLVKDALDKKKKLKNDELEDVLFDV